MTGTKHLEMLCTAYCGCGHCCAYEWGLTLPGGAYLALGDSDAPPPKHNPKAKQEQGPLQKLQQVSASLSAVFSNPQKHFQVKKRIDRPGCKPGLFCKYWTRTSQKGQPYEGVTSSGTYPGQARDKALVPKHPVQHVQKTLLPWTTLPRFGTIAADTKHFPFGTRMLVPGYGWAEVQDHGGGVHGGLRIDIFHDNHLDAIIFGRKNMKVLVVPPGTPHPDQPKIDETVQGPPKVVRDLWSYVVGVRHEEDPKRKGRKHVY